MRTVPALAALLVSAAAIAQSYSVSPPAHANTQGNASNPIPFYNANARYMQIHGDLKGTPRVMQGMSIRRGQVGTQTNATARTLDLTVLMANSNIQTTSTTFAANYLGTPTVVKPKGTVNFPDWTASGGTPEPWTIVIPFTAPWPYLGTNDLLWEWLVENNTGSTLAYYADIYSGLTGPNQDMTQATQTAIGTGCTATGQSRPMTVSARSYTSNALQGFYFRATGSSGPLNAPSNMMIGIVNPNLTVPGLCTNLYTLPMWYFPTTSHNTTGSITMPDVLVPWNPGYQGAKLYTQAISLDAGQTGLPLALSNGLETVIPAMTPPGSSPIVRIFDLNSATATTAIVNYYAYGLIVRFTH